jgi:hypothetical protein
MSSGILGLRGKFLPLEKFLEKRVEIFWKMVYNCGV